MTDRPRGGDTVDAALEWSATDAVASARATRASATGLVAGVLSYRVAGLFAVVLGSHALAPGIFFARTFDVNFHGTYSAGSIGAMLSSWDGHWYLALAESGYAALDGRAAAFYPLWPFLIGRVAPLVGGNGLLAALLLSHALFALACALLYQRLYRQEDAGAAARSSVLLLALYPGSIYYGLAYSESLFLALSMALFSQLGPRGEVAWPALAPAFLLPLARPLGVFAALPLAVSAWLAHRAGRLGPSAVAAALAPLAGWGTYLLWMHAATGSALAGFDAQAHFVFHAGMGRLFRPLEFLAALGDVRGVLAMQGGALDRALFLLYAALLLPLWRRSRVEFSWALALGMVPAMTMGLACFTRFLAVIFPLFALVGSHLAEPRHCGRRRAVLACCAGLQLIFLFVHVNNGWVA